MNKIETIHMSSGKYSNIQDAIDKAADNITIVLDSDVYSESLVISKSLKIIGQSDTVIKLEENQIIIKGEVEVFLENLRIEIQPDHHDTAIMVSDSSLSCSSCTIISASQQRDLFSCIWVENGSFSLKDSKVDSYANLIKIINSENFELINSHCIMKEGKIAVEAHGIRKIKVIDNEITSLVNFLRCTKSVDFIFENNNISLSIQPSLNNPVFLHLDGLEHGEHCTVSNNIINTEKDLFITISNSLSMNRKIVFSNNEIYEKNDSESYINLDHLQGILVIENNKISKSNISILKCSELLLKQNEVMVLSIKQLNLLMAADNKFLKHVTINETQHVNFKKNSIINDRNDCEAIKLNAVDKLVFEQNKISSVDHGLTFLNAGDNLDILIQKNEFISCRKRGINIASTMQKKYLKTEVNILNNIFMSNDKGIYIDDRNLKACCISENYFSENREAVIVLGGKSTSNIEVTGNYLDMSSQRIELRNTNVCKLSHNELSDVKLNIRGCDEIIVNDNHIEKKYFSKEKSFRNEISIMTGGCLTVSRNVMLNGKPRHEKKEVFNHLNITSYEKNPAISIYENQSLTGMRKKKLFESDIKEDVILYPDESLLSTIRFQMHSEDHISDMNIDDVLKADFFKLKDAFKSICNKVSSKIIGELVLSAVNQFQIEIFAGRDTNDIYRFIVKSNETIEMLRLYTSLEDETDVATEERIVSIMHNYLAVLNQFLNKKTENEHDKLSAQLKLLENLL